MSPKAEAKHRILLIDDHPVVLAGLVALLSGEPDLAICGTSGSIREALAKIQEMKMDLAIVDIGIGGLAGLDLIQDLKLRHARLKVLCFSVHEESFYAERALRAGAVGYIMKTADAPTLLKAVRTVLRGQVYLSEGMGRRILKRLAGSTPAEACPIDRLSNRELQIIHHIGESRDNRQIADLMSVSLKTVEAHRSKIKDKLQLRTTSDLIRFATRWVEHEAGFVEPG